MHIKRIHEMIEKLTECAKAELDRGVEQVDVEEFGAVADIIKDLCEAEKSAKMVKMIEESEEDEKKSDEYFLRMLKEEYGEDEGKRYYDNYRYRASGRFAPKGRGTYSPSRGRSSRGYEEMPFYFDPEWYRDMDRMSMNRMYYSGSGSSGGASSGSTSGNASGGASGASSGGSSDGSMGYSEGESRGYQRGYSEGSNDGYSRGYNDGRSSGGGNRNESRSERARRNYTETKDTHKSNNPQDKQANLKELEKYLSELSEDMTELFKNMSPEERNMAKQKITALASKM